MTSKQLETLQHLLKSGNPMMSFVLGMKSTSRQSLDGQPVKMNGQAQLETIVTLLSMCSTNYKYPIYPEVTIVLDSLQF